MNSSSSASSTSFLHSEPYLSTISKTHSHYNHEKKMKIESILINARETKVKKLEATKLF